MFNKASLSELISPLDVYKSSGRLGRLRSNSTLSKRGSVRPQTDQLEDIAEELNRFSNL